jgi:hypothetical protein
MSPSRLAHGLPARRHPTVRTQSARCSDALWDLVQSSKAYQSPPRAALYNDPSTIAAVDGAVAACRAGQLQDLVPRTMLSLAYLGGPVCWQEEMETLVESLRDVSNLNSFRNLDDAARALRICRHKGHPELLCRLDARGAQLLEDVPVSETESRLASSLVHNIVYHGYVPENLLSRLADVQCANLRLCGATAVASAVLGWEGDGHRLSSILMNHLRDSHAANTLADSELALVHPFLLYHCQENDPLLEASIASKGALKRAHTVSTFQKEVYDILTSRLGISCQMEGDVRGISVDILVDRARVAIEANGAHHYYRNAPDQLVPSSAFKSVMMDGDGWKLIHLDQRVWDGLQGRQERTGLLVQSLQSLQTPLR